MLKVHIVQDLHEISINIYDHIIGTIWSIYLVKNNEHKGSWIAGTDGTG